MKTFVAALRDRELDARGAVRLALLSTILLAAVPLAASYTARSTADRTAGGAGDPGASDRLELDGATVVTEQTGHLVVYGPNESVRYHESRYERYWDVDPTPPGEATVLVGVTEHTRAEGTCAGDTCLRNVVVRLNLSTGERTRAFSRIYGDEGSNEWHDVDRVLEVNENGSAVWWVPATKPYDAERLGTGDESAGGPAMAKIRPGHGQASGGPPGAAGSASALGAAWGAVSWAVPPFLFNSLLFALPAWMAPQQVLLVVVVAVAALALVAAEAYWRVRGPDSDADADAAT